MTPPLTAEQREAGLAAMVALLLSGCHPHVTAHPHSNRPSHIAAIRDCTAQRPLAIAWEMRHGALKNVDHNSYVVNEIFVMQNNTGVMILMPWGEQERYGVDCDTVLDEAEKVLMTRMGWDTPETVKDDAELDSYDPPKQQALRRLLQKDPRP